MRKFFIGLTLVYLSAHLINLTELPVFADEAIYIRWAQLIIDDWQQYLFFPLNDGKTPLFMWMMVPFQFIFSDPLFAGRFVSLLGGIVQIVFTILSLRVLKVSKHGQMFGAVLTALLPFWFFHHQMALIDGWLVAWLSMSLYGSLRFATAKKRQAKRKGLVFLGLGFGLALLTKLPAVLALPGLLLPLFLSKKVGSPAWLRNNFEFGMALLVGGLLFLLLKIHPAFGQLFNRGGDFLFGFREVFFEGMWLQTIRSVPKYVGYFVWYLSPGVIILLLASLFARKQQLAIHVLFWGGVAFLAPIALMGKVVFPRYLVPAGLFFTLAVSVGFDVFVQQLVLKAKDLRRKIIAASILSILLANVVGASINFIQPLILDSDNTPFVESDVEQYLGEWSSGHGIYETVQELQFIAQDKKVAVATEGFFGTLPDGILMYLHQADVSNIYVAGVGVSVPELPEDFVARAQDFDEVWLVRNSHRSGFDIDKKYFMLEYCRPFDAPCLHVWDVTHLVKDSEEL